MTLFILNIVLAAAWAISTGGYTMLNLLFGFILGGLALYVVRERFDGAETYFGRSGRILGLAWTFIRELILSGVRVALFALKPRLDFTPGIVAIPLSTDRDVEITILANMITLTPGTMSIDVSADKATIFVHAIDASDPDDLRRTTKRVFERRIMDAFR